MPKLNVGAYVASLKAAPSQVRDRQAFLERSRAKDAPPVVGGLTLVGLGGSCGKPAFALPYTVRWDENSTSRLEAIAQDFGCFVEYGAYPHLKLEVGGTEVAAVQDWTTFGIVFVRPGYERGEELLARLAAELAPAGTPAA